MRQRSESLLCAVLLPFLAGGAQAEEPPRCQTTPLPLKIESDETNARAELSGVVMLGSQLVTISNEGLNDDKTEYRVQIYEGNPETGYSHSRDELLYETDGDCNEADFEALARDGETLFAIGSHSYDRKKQNKNKPREENFKRLTEKGVSHCEARDELRRFRLTSGDEVETLQKTSLRPLIDAHPVVGGFATIPNKENGVDIEGLAVFNGSLYVGFRGPILRENYVPVLRLPTDLEQIAPDPTGKDTVFVNLGGRGIRDLAPGPEGKELYVLAGPNGDEWQSFAIFRWDGNDQLSDDGQEAKKPELLCQIDLLADDAKKSKPEGIAYLDTTAEGLRFVLVYDGVAPLKAGLVTIKVPD